MSQCSSADFKKIVKIMQANENNTSLMKAFLPVLGEFVKLLKDEYNTVVQDNITFTNVEIVQFDAFADMLHVITFNFVNAPQTNDPALYCDLVKVYSTCENIYRSLAQYGKGILDENAGQFFASPLNMQEMVDASTKMLDEHKSNEPVTFVQVA